MGGAQFQAKLIVEKLVEVGNFEVFFLTRRAPYDHTYQDGYTLIRFGRSTGPRFALDTFALLQTLRKLKPDIVYSRVGCAYTGIAAHYCKMTEARMVWHVASELDVQPWHTFGKNKLSWGFLDKRILEYGIRHCDTRIAQTQDQKKLLLKNYNEKIHSVIPNFHPKPEEKIIKSKIASVVWVANLKQVKQPEVFCSLAKSLSANPIQFTLIGDSQLPKAQLRRLESKIDSVENLTWIGRKSQEEVNRFLASSHVLVNTSSVEGFSNTFIQAWMRETLVISLNVDPDLALSEKGLGLFANGDIKMLSQMVQEGALNPSRHVEVIKRAKDHAMHHHTLENFDNLLKALEGYEDPIRQTTEAEPR